MSEMNNAGDLENQLLELLTQDSAPAAAWLAVLTAGVTAGIPAATREWAAMAQEALAKAGDVAGGSDLLKWRADNTPPDQMTAKDWLKVADVLAGSDPYLLALIQEAGFGQKLAARECVRRLGLLLSLQPGALCLHRTWGFGVVQKADALYRKIEINFRGRPGHGLAMKVAAESLEVLAETHLLAQWHRDRERIRALVRDNPAEVVRLALASFGPMPVATLQKTLVSAELLPDSDWKRFWDAARKVLKADPLVMVPAKRTEPLCLLNSAAGFDDTWFDRLANERELKTIVERLGELAERAPAHDTIPAAQRQVMTNRLAFVLHSATSRQPGIKLQAALLAARLAVPPAECDWPAAAREFLRGPALVEVLHDLPARKVAPALEFLWAQDPEALRAALLEQLGNLYFGPLQEVMVLLRKQGSDEACRDIFAATCAAHTIRQEMLLWLLRNVSLIAEWDLPLPAALAPIVLAELEQDYKGERLKTRKQLREAFEDAAWLKAVFDGMTPSRQQDFFRRLNQSPAWPGLDRQVLQAKILKQFPQLHGVIMGAAAETPTASSGQVTSHRSYRERQEKLERLLNVEIPANSKEIAIARSYGDLSENFEYKAAKDMQRVLMARQADLEGMLAKVRPTDFAEAPTDRAGVGTTVTLAYPDGHREFFHILGEWDQFPEKHIISSNTRLAQALAGKQAGEDVEVPAEDGPPVTCRVETVTPLPDDIKEWVK